MTSSTSLYRKYRSQTFDELVGQEPVVRTLKNAIASEQLTHAYLFTGPRGVGKTSAARLLARASNCLADAGEKPCNTCLNCRAAGRDIATDLIEIDAASNTGVDNIREVIERAQFAPSVWKAKFYIIDEVHMLSVSAFNALLKTLEEPPPHTTFILATTEVHKVPATVASRCQRYDFRRIPLRAMVERLSYICDQEGISAEREALELVARQATGSLRDALSLLDQLRVYSPDEVTLAAVRDLLGASGSEKVADFVDALVNRDLPAGLAHINSVLDEGLDLRQFNRQIVEHLRFLLLVKSGTATGDPGLLDVTSELAERLRAASDRASLAEILRWTRIFAEAEPATRSASLSQLPLEMALVEATLPPQPVTHEVAGPPSGNGVAPTREGMGRTPAGPTRSSAPRASDLPVKPPDLPESSTARQPAARHEPVESFSVGPDAAGEQNPLEAATQLSGAPADAPAHESEARIAGAQGESLLAEPEGGGGEEFERLVKLWPQVIEQINARAKAIGAVFRDYNRVRPYSLDGNICTIAFKYQIHVMRSREVRQREVIETALSRVLGRPVQIESVLFDGSDPAEGGNGGAPVRPAELPGNPQPPAPSPYETTRGRAAMNIFGIKEFDES